MKKNIALILAIVAFLIVAFFSYSVIKSKKDVPTGESIIQDDFSKRITVNQSGCNIALQLPVGYLISSVPNADTCFLTITNDSNENPIISIATLTQENVTNVTNLTTWVTEKVKKEMRSEQTEPPRNGQVNNSVQVNSKDTAYPAVETYILHGSTIYTVTMTARKTATSFTAEEQKIYSTLLKSILLN